MHRVAMSDALAARRGREENYIRNRFSLAKRTNMAAKRIAEELMKPSEGDILTTGVRR